MPKEYDPQESSYPQREVPHDANMEFVVHLLKTPIPHGE